MIYETVNGRNSETVIFNLDFGFWNLFDIFNLSFEIRSSIPLSPSPLVSLSPGPLVPLSPCLGVIKLYSSVIELIFAVALSFRVGDSAIR